MITESKQWEKINTFEGDDFFHKITAWDPNTNGVRYLKMLLYNLGMNLTKKEFEILDRIKNRNTDNPYSVTINGRTIDYDYLQTIYEVSVLKKYDGYYQENYFDSVLEIGAGYGRTCHGLLSNLNINEYTIIDLENMLEHSKKYLKSVLDPITYEKITFLTIDEFHKLKDYDIAIQIDAFNEMDRETVETYLKNIKTHCNMFYTKNPVGKYLDKSLDNHILGDEMVQNALSSGILTDMVDINDNQNIKRASNKFIETYKFIDWQVNYEGWAKPVSFMWESLYVKL